MVGFTKTFNYQQGLISVNQNKTKDLFLFFGYYSKISGGKMPNEIGADWLTVTGAAGSENYQCPNTSPYISADTDNVWFKIDASQRFVSKNELIGFDFKRTLIKYADINPFEIEIIAIFKPGITATTNQLNDLFKYFWLPVFWNNSLNPFGHVKDNRVFNKLWIAQTIPDGSPINLTAVVISDVQINLSWAIGSTDQDGHRIERSADGLTWVVIDTVTGNASTYTDLTVITNTRYYYKIKAYKGAFSSNYSNIVDDWTAMKITATAAGTGAGTSLIELTTSASIIVTCDSNGTFTDDTIGTNPNKSRSINGISKRLYFKCNSGNSKILIFSKNTLLKIGREDGYDIWSAGVNAPVLNAFPLSSIARSVTSIYQNTTLNVTGLISDLPPFLQYIQLNAGNTVSGNLSGLPATMKNVKIIGSNTISGNVASFITGILQCSIVSPNGLLNHYTAGHNWGTTMDELRVGQSAGNGLSSTEVDNLLIDIAATVTTWINNKRIILQAPNAARTAASNAAVATLTARGCSVTTP